MQHSTYIAKLQQLRKEHADGALNKGEDDEPSFRYGRLCGINQGLRMAEQLVTDMLKEERERDV